MKIFLYLSLVTLIYFLNGCGCNREFEEEQNSSTISDTNQTESIAIDENISSMKALREAIEKERNAKNSIPKEQNDTTPPIKPTVVSYSNLVEKQLQLTVGREIGAKVYIEDVSYGVIDSNREVKIKLDNPHENYFETFKIILTDKAGNDSPPLIYTTTFQRAKLGSNYTYYIPKGVNFLNRGFSDKGMIITGYPRNRNSAIALIMPFNSYDNGADILKLNPTIESIQQSEFVKKFINISEQELEAQQTVIAEYLILTHKPISALALIKSIFYKSYRRNLYYLHSDENAQKDTFFNMKISLLQKYKNEIYLSIAFIPYESSLRYQTMINSMINSQNIRKNSTPIYMKEEILKAKTVDKEQEYANFLFVIDDSGSMSSYQKAISQTAKEFASAIRNVGIKFRVAIITTGEEDEAFAVLDSEGVIENDTISFQELLKVGTDGSATETAIYNIEQALKSKKYGDKDDGILTKLEMPKANEKLSIIILSDESSNYESRAKKKFDIENNLIVNRDYRVYLIGNREEDEFDYLYSYRNEKRLFKHKKNSYGLYGKLVKKTGGLVEDISHIYSYDRIMNSIVQDVLGDFGYKLQQDNIIESTIYVNINDENVPHSDKNGWRYVQTTNSILFSGRYIPNEDDTILVRYSYSLNH